MSTHSRRTTPLLALALPLAVGVLTAFTGCAHGKNGSLDSLKPSVETFHQRVRWRDYRGAAELLTPERRDGFEKAVRARNDDKNLTITDYQLEDAKLAQDGQSAEVVSRLSWVRLPSVSEQSEVVRSKWVFREGVWLLDAQDNGPFAAELKSE